MFAAEQQVQQRHQQADAEALEQHYEQGARQDGGEHQGLMREIWAQEAEDVPKLGELLAQPLHDRGSPNRWSAHSRRRSSSRYACAAV